MANRISGRSADAGHPNPYTPSPEGEGIHSYPVPSSCLPRAAVRTPPRLHG